MKVQNEVIESINKRFAYLTNEVNNLSELNLTWQLKELLPKGKKIKDFKDVENLKQYLLNRIEKIQERELQNKVKYFEAIQKAPDFKSLKITIEWKRSQTWGYNPTATLEVWNEIGFERVYTAKVYGCGYCKESAVMADVLNQSLSLKKLLLNASNENKTTYGMRGERFSGGGVGVSSLQNAFHVCGFDLKKVASGSRFDAYSCEIINNLNN